MSIALSVIIVLFFSFGINSFKNNFNKNKQVNISERHNEVVKLESDNTITEENDFVQEKKEEVNDEFDWYIEIPKIKVYAPIEEGTEDEVLNRSVGHFEDTSRRNGNCGLAAHNRGYRVNYFAKLKELEKGDMIYYYVDGKKYKYKVNEMMIIYETDWSMLEDTEDDRITLITCVENRDEYRLCVQGILIEE